MKVRKRAYDEVDVLIWGDEALFTQETTKAGGERSTYPIPTAEALENILKHVYWKPSIMWVIKDVRVMNPIQTQTRNITFRKREGLSTNPCVPSISGYLDKSVATMDRASITYLRKPCYQVRAQLVFNERRADVYKDDWKLEKHRAILMRKIRQGNPRYPIYFGTSECTAYIKACSFGEGEGYYDNSGSIPFGLMYHSYLYPDEVPVGMTEYENKLHACSWYPVMTDGYIHYPKAIDTPVKRYLCNQEVHIFPPKTKQALAMYEKEEKREEELERELDVIVS